MTMLGVIAAMAIIGFIRGIYDPYYKGFRFTGGLITSLDYVLTCFCIALLFSGLFYIIGIL